MSRTTDPRNHLSNMCGHQWTPNSNHSLELKENVSNATSFIAQLALPWLAYEREAPTATGKELHDYGSILSLLVPSWRVLAQKSSWIGSNHLHSNCLGNNVSQWVLCISESAFPLKVESNKNVFLWMLGVR